MNNDLTSLAYEMNNDLTSLAYAIGISVVIIILTISFIGYIYSDE